MDRVNKLIEGFRGEASHAAVRESFLLPIALRGRSLAGANSPEENAKLQEASKAFYEAQRITPPSQ